MTETLRPSIPTSLFEFAYIPAWTEQLYILERMAAPEPWKYKKTTFDSKNTENPILENYINNIFRIQAINYMNAATQEEADRIIYLRTQTACIHTGLYTPDWRAIFMLFERNKKLDSMLSWCFRAFVDEKKDAIRHIPLPLHPLHSMRASMPAYDTARQLRLDTDHMLTPGHVEGCRWRSAIIGICPCCWKRRQNWPGGGRRTILA